MERALSCLSAKSNSFTGSDITYSLPWTTYAPLVKKKKKSKQVLLGPLMENYTYEYLPNVHWFNPQPSYAYRAHVSSYKHGLFIPPYRHFLLAAQRCCTHMFLSKAFHFLKVLHEMVSDSNKMHFKLLKSAEIVQLNLLSKVRKPNK